MVRVNWRRFLVGAVLGGILGVAAVWGLSMSGSRPRSGVLLTVGPAAKADPYAVAQGAVTHGEPVLLDFGDGEFVFFVNRAEEVLALVNRCGERTRPIMERRLPMLVEARFRIRSMPPYHVDTASTRYRFSAVAESSAACS